MTECMTCGGTGVYPDREDDPEAGPCYLVRLDPGSVDPGDGCNRCDQTAVRDGKSPTFFMLTRPQEVTDLVLCVPCAWEAAPGGTPCPECHSPPMTGRGIVYVFQGMAGTSVVVDTDCGILAHEVGEVSDRCDEVGLDEPPDVGLWKALVEFWSSRSYYGDYDSGYNTIGDYVEADDVDEPRCAAAPDRTHSQCSGAPTQRGEGEDAPWACDKHAGQVS